MKQQATFKQPVSTDQVRPFPLLWPPEQVRTPSYERKKKRWSTAHRLALSDLRDECTRVSIHDWEISTGREPGTGKIHDPGVVLWFMQRVGDAWVMSYYASDSYRDSAENIKAIAMTIQRLRQIGDYGCYTVEKAMRGAAYDALPPPEAPPRDCWEVLEISPTSPRVVVDAVYKALSKQRHPDSATGSTEAFQELQRAYEAAKAALG